MCSLLLEISQRGDKMFPTFASRLFYMFSMLIIFTSYICLANTNETLVKEMLMEDMKKTWDCNREWPKLDIFMPVHLEEGSRRNNEWENVFFRSFMTFWPFKKANTVLRFVFDEELLDSNIKKTFVDDVLTQKKASFDGIFPTVEFSYQKPVENVYRTGHDRQQYLMFYADQYSDAEYVAFVDTDSFIHSVVDREDIFHDGKPIVHGKIGYLKKSGRDAVRKKWAANTWHATGEEEPMICMSYFPIVFKTSHFKDLREFISSQWKMPFDEAFHAFSSEWGTYSQFNIMCAYFFWHKKEEYSWAIHDADPNWNTELFPPAFGQWADKWVFTPDMMIHRPYIAAHLDGRWLHDYEGELRTKMIQMTGSSLCYCPAGDNGCNYVIAKNASNLYPEIMAYHSSEGCPDRDAKDALGYYTEMHQFEDTNFNVEWITPDKAQILLVHEERHQRMKSCNHTYYFF